VNIRSVYMKTSPRKKNKKTSMSHVDRSSQEVNHLL
jgi:hypothetical protein